MFYLGEQLRQRVANLMILALLTRVGGYMKKLYVLSLFLGVLGMLTSFVCMANSKPAVCSGTLAAPGILAGTYNNGAVVQGVCYVAGGPAIVKGDLTISQGSALAAFFALNDVTGVGTSSLTVTGDVNVLSGGSFIGGCEPIYFPCADDANAAAGGPGTLTSSDLIYGNVNELLPLGVLLHASSVAGSISELGGGGGESCALTGIFGEFYNPPYSDYEDNTIGGSLSIIGMQSCWYGALRDQVKGSVNNLLNMMGDPDANEVVSNTVYGNMICLGNNPKDQFGDSLGVSNKVGGLAVGECAFNALQPNPATLPYVGYPGPVPGPLEPISVRLH